MSETVEKKLATLAEHLAEELGYELYHLEYRKAGSTSLLRVFIDSPKGVGLADCEAVSRRLGAALEVEDIIPSSYVLEVSSPGLDRPLFREKDYDRFAGRKVRLTTFEPVSGNRHPSGAILSCRGGILRLALQDGGEIELPLSKVAAGHLEIEIETSRAKKGAGNHAKIRTY